MRVMGIDPGTLKMGVGIVDKKGATLIPSWYDTVTFSSKVSIHKRLEKIYQTITDLIAEWHPDVIALEDIFYGVSFKSAIRIGEARAAVILAATRAQIDVIEYPPTRVKNAVSGFGRAAKVQVQHMVKNILRLETVPQTDAADALALAICHINAQASSNLGKEYV